MKKILISLSIIGAVAAIVIGATGAFFSDVETSTGNTLTAGTLDLKVWDGANYVDTPNPNNVVLVALEDLKPSIPQFVTKWIKVVDNPAKVYLHIDYESCDTGILTEPEEEEEARNGEYCWLDEWTAYDLSVNGRVIIPLEEDYKLYWDVMSCWIPLGTFEPGTEIRVDQSFHLQDEVTNWAQGDILYFTEEFLALQTNADDPPDLFPCWGAGEAAKAGR